jgi:hypothetical protein
LLVQAAGHGSAIWLQNNIEEPEPVERQLFAGAEAESFGLALGMQIHKCYKKTLIFQSKNLKLGLKINNS